ncbi:MAG TPA: immunity 8 family protein [Anaeromyxobacteraceae bacterium]|jgi:hypothetical protein|nr:immunity 8 family protein [Anaeromyxobacteraceae bacterium]
MRARLKSLRSDDVPDLARYAPALPDEFAVPLILEVGPLGLRGREEFELLVVTPRWLLRRHGAGGVVSGRSKLIVFEWDFARVKAFLTREVAACSGESWPEVARRVGRFADWPGDAENVIGLR